MRRGLVGGVVVGLLLVACGGSSAMTRAEYVKKANAVCRGAAKQVAAVPIPGADDVDALPRTAATIVALERKALGRLEAIHPPKADRTEIAKWLALVDQTIDQAETSAKSQQDGDLQRAVTANTNGAALDRRADELARGYGVRLCVHAAAPPQTSTTTSGQAVAQP